ncbi:MAG: acetamidase/formamidase family protein [Roseobacter sp.]
MSWIETSIMGRKGVAKGAVQAEHSITIEDQKTFHYVYGPYADPVLEVDPGAVVTIETHDAFEGKVVTEDDKPSAVLEFPFLNPQSGPIHVRGAEKGDALAVRIVSITPRGPQPVGTTCLIPEFGGLVSTGQTAMLNAPLPEIVKKIVVDEAGVHWSDTLTLPYEPFIGTIGTAPQIEAISSLQPDYYGGNMDLPDMAPGAIVYLPVNTPGGYLYVGDCHAIQGDGELCGVALEIPATVVLHIDLVKGHGNAWPQLETEDAMMFIGSARPLEDASRIAYRELVRWVAAQTGQSEEEAYMLLTMCGKVRLGNMVDPKYSVGASILKKYLV